MALAVAVAHFPGTAVRLGRHRGPTFAAQIVRDTLDRRERAAVPIGFATRVALPVFLKVGLRDDALSGGPRRVDAVALDHRAGPPLAGRTFRRRLGGQRGADREPLTIL